MRLRCVIARGERGLLAARRRRSRSIHSRVVAARGALLLPESVSDVSVVVVPSSFAGLSTPQRRVGHFFFRQYCCFTFTEIVFGRHAFVRVHRIHLGCARAPPVSPYSCRLQYIYSLRPEYYLSLHRTFDRSVSIIIIIIPMSLSYHTIIIIISYARL